MRTYGRLYNTDGTYTWTEVTTSPSGDDTEIWLTTLAQTLKLSREESPFYANYGIPAEVSVQMQQFPDYYMAQTQGQFTQYFTSLSVSKLPGTTPTYTILAVGPSGSLWTKAIAT